MVSSHLRIALTVGPNLVCCDPTLLLHHGNRSSSNKCLLLSTQNNKQSPDTRMSQSNILPTESFGIGKVFQEFDSTFWHRRTTRWMFCCQLCTLEGSLSATATSSTLKCVTVSVTSSNSTSNTFKLTTCWRIHFPVYLGTDKKQQSNAWTSVKSLYNSHLMS